MDKDINDDTEQFGLGMAEVALPIVKSYFPTAPPEKLQAWIDFSLGYGQTSRQVEVYRNKAFFLDICDVGQLCRELTPVIASYVDILNSAIRESIVASMRAIEGPAQALRVDSVWLAKPFFWHVLKTPGLCGRSGPTDPWTILGRRLYPIEGLMSRIETVATDKRSGEWKLIDWKLLPPQAMRQLTGA